jgi:hypothetical protein
MGRPFITSSMSSFSSGGIADTHERVWQKRMNAITAPIMLFTVLGDLSVIATFATC